MRASCYRVVQCALVLLVLGFTGCFEQTGVDRASRLAVELDQYRNNAATLEAAISSSQAALRELFRHPVDDLAGPFNTYRASVAQVDKALQRLRTAQQRVDEAGNRYFNYWQQDVGAIAAADVRGLSEQRREEVQQSHAAILTQGQSLQLELNQLLSDLRDVERYLQTDLSVAGVHTLNPVLQRIEADASPVKGALSDLAEQAHSLARRLAPTAQTGSAQ